jgi:hypothetical protein
MSLEDHESQGESILGTEGGFHTWEAILNEILELRNAGMLDGAEQAYNVLNEVETAVLPGWKEHGRKLLTDNGVGFEKLQAMGIQPKKIEMLYQAMYAFAFGFCQVVKRCIFDCTDPAEVMISISKVYSILLAEALETIFINLLQVKLEQKAAEAAELLRQLLISRKKVESLIIEGVHARECQEAAERNLKEVERKCAAQVKTAMRQMEEYKSLYEGRLEDITKANKQREEAVAESARLLKKMEYLEEELAATVEMYEAQVAKVAEWKAKHSECETELQEALERHARYEETIKAQKDRIRELERDLSEAKHATTAEHEKYKKTAQELVHMTARRDEASARCESLEREMNRRLHEEENKRKVMVGFLQTKTASLEDEVRAFLDIHRYIYYIHNICLHAHKHAQRERE